MTSTVSNTQNTAVNQLFSSLSNGSGSNAVSQSDFSSLLLMAYSQGVADTQKLGSSTLPQATFTPYVNTCNTCNVQDGTEVLGTTTAKYQPHEIMGKFITAIIDGDISQGYVKNVFVENGVMYAECNRGLKHNFYVPVNSIVEVEDDGWFPDKKIGEPPAGNWKYIKARGYIEYAADNKTEIGWWEFNRSKWLWVLKEIVLPKPIIEKILVPCDHEDCIGAEEAEPGKNEAGGGLTGIRNKRSGDGERRDSGAVESTQATELRRKSGSAVPEKSETASNVPAPESSKGGRKDSDKPERSSRADVNTEKAADKSSERSGRNNKSEGKSEKQGKSSDEE